MEWPAGVERVASFLRRTGAEARIEELSGFAPTTQAVADEVGCTLAQVVTLLVLVCDGAPVVALVPGDRRADTGKISRLLGARRTVIARPDEVAAATGFDPEAVPPFPLDGVGVVLVERALLRHRLVWAGAGSEMHLVSLAPTELVRLTRGRVEDLVLESR